MVQLVVGRIGRAHGIRGDVLVDVRTDEPEDRFAVGAVLATEPPEAGPLTVASARWHSGRLVVGFAGYADRTAAESLGGIRLVVDSADLPPCDDPDEFHDHELVGLAALTRAGEPLGRVTDVVHGPAGDLLVVERAAVDDVTPPPAELLIPFVREIVPSVDVEAGRVVIDPPAGLLEL